MAIVLQLERLILNQSNGFPLNRVPNSTNDLKSIRISNVDVFGYEVELITIKLSSEH